MESIQWLLTGAIALGAGVIAFLAGYQLRRRIAQGKLADAETRAAQILSEADREAELRKKTAGIEAREEWFRAKAKFDEEMWTARQEFERREQSMAERENAVKRRGDQLQQRERELRQVEKDLETRTVEVTEQHARLDRILEEQNLRLEQISGLTAEAARLELLKNLEDEIRGEAALMARRIRDEAERSAEREAQRIIGIAIQRLAADNRSNPRSRW